MHLNLKINGWYAKSIIKWYGLFSSAVNQKIDDVTKHEKAQTKALKEGGDGITKADTAHVEGSVRRIVMPIIVLIDVYIFKQPCK